MLVLAHVCHLRRSVAAAFLFFLTSASLLFASSNDWFARSWQSDEGLPDNNVTGVAKAEDGFLWVGTTAGLMRFDGVRFQEFLPTYLEGVPSRGVRGLMLDRRNQLWLVLDRGLIARVRSNSGRVFTMKDGLPATQPQSMAEDAEGAIWFGCGLRPFVIRIKDDTVKVFGTKDGVAATTSGWLAADAKGQIWLAKNKTLSIFRDGRFQPQTALPEQNARLAAAKDGLWIVTSRRLMSFQEGGKPKQVFQLPTGVVPTVLREDRDGAVWIGTASHGLFRFFDGELESIHTSHPQISCITLGRAANIWVGTSGGGLNRLRVRSVELVGAESGLPFESVRSVAEDTEGSIWATTQNGILARLAGSRWANITTSADWPGGHASCVVSDSSGAIWIGTSDRGLVRFENGHYASFRRPEGLKSESIRALLAGAGGEIWFATSVGVQRFRDGKIETISLPPETRYIRALAEDTDHDIWLGTTDGHLLRISDGQTAEDMTKLQGVALSIRALHAGPDGSLWIGYAGSGLGRLKNGKLQIINASQGLHDNFISQIVTDDADRLWLGGNGGVSHISIKEFGEVAEGRLNRLRSVSYGRGDGLPSLQANYDYFPGIVRARDGRIWMATRTGLAVVYPENIHDNPEPPPVLVERVVLDGQTLGLYDSQSPLHAPELRKLTDLRASHALKLNANYRKLEIDYTALSFVAPENVSFRYRLDNYDDDWVEGGTQRTANYPRLGAGDYKFHVIACNNAGVWNDTGATLAFTVLPFFWQTWPFRIGALSAFTLLVIGIVRYVSFRRLRKQVRLLEQQAALHKERARIAKDIHDDLGASLTQIALLSDLTRHDMAEPQKAGEHVQKIASTARQVITSLDEIVWAVNPRNDTLPHLIDYLGQFTLGFLRVPGIRCRLDLPENPPPTNISADVRHNLFLAVKEALNNIVKHAHAQEVWLRVNVQNGALRVVVEDDGQGFNHGPQAAWEDGLRNMRQRLVEIGGECHIQSRAGAGTSILFEIPWQQN